jgi:HPt (histidine-containing phosphotransfer) domain-containing protein
MAGPLLDLAILDELERQLGRERVLKVITVQMVNAHDLRHRLGLLEAAPDPTQIKALAHQIAGSSGSMGLMRLSDQAISLEMAVDAAAASLLPAMVGDLARCLAESQAALRDRYPEVANL